MLTRIEFSRDADALIAHVEACWREACGGGAMPTRTAISPSKLGRALPYVTLIDVVPGEPKDFRYRLIGQHLILNWGRNVTGKRLLELPPAANGRPVYETYIKCVVTGEPKQFEISVLNANGTKRQLQGKVFPLGNGGEPPCALLGVGLYLD